MNNASTDWNDVDLRGLLRGLAEKQNLAADYLPNVQTALTFYALQDAGFTGSLQQRIQTFEGAEGKRAIYGINFKGETLNLAGHTFDEILDGRYDSKLRQDLKVASTQDSEVSETARQYLQSAHVDKMNLARDSVTAWLEDQSSTGPEKSIRRPRA